MRFERGFNDNAKGAPAPASDSPEELRVRDLIGDQ